MKRALKETVDEIIQNNPDGDTLWNFALDFQDKAVRKDDTKATLKYFKKALKIAKASRDQYLLEASNDAEREAEFLQNATLAEDELIKPFKKKIKRLKKDLEDTESEVTTQEIQGAILPVYVPAPLEIFYGALQLNTFFAPAHKYHLNNLFSLQDFENLDDIGFITGTPLEKIQLLLGRLSSVIKSKIIQIELPDNDIKLINADDLMNISRDCTQKLLNWIQPYSSEDNFEDLCGEILRTGEKAARAAKTIYELFHPIKVRVCKGQIAYINQQIEKLENQSSQTLDL